ncbi:HEPN domain-containing protein [Candidatus Calescamantes bacterium]|nr:HEPN domain-containing protein [Candidatus Calescamantes bacterium]
MEYKEEVCYWLKAAAHDLEVAEVLFEKGKYDWCLFIAHLVLEKTLKALYVRDNARMPPPIHKLDVLARETKLTFSLEDLEFLKKVNEFNIQTRYPDKKFSFYKICSKEFTEKFFNRIKEFYKWLLKEIK